MTTPTVIETAICPQGVRIAILPGLATAPLIQTTTAHR